MAAKTICTLTITIPEGKTLEEAAIDIGADPAYELIVVRALEAVRRRMLGYNQSPLDPVIIGLEADEPV